MGVMAERQTVNIAHEPININSDTNHRIVLIVFRVDPPTPEELQKNLTIMHMKKINAAKLDEKYSAGKVNVPQKVTGMSSFPVYEEYESGIGTRKQEEEREEAKEERENKK